MNKWILAVFSIVIALSATLTVPVKITPDQIFSRNKDAVVRVYTNGNFSGCGFAVSEELVVTANHVIATEESNYSDIFPTIEVEVFGTKYSYPATVVDHSAVSDTALLRVPAGTFNHVELGDWKEVKPSDAATMITFLPTSKVPLLLTGIVSGTGNMSVGNTNADVAIFEMPIRKGFSGSPMFDSRGRVIGIVNTRLVGISPDLESIRKTLNTNQNQGGVEIIGVEFRPAMLGLINSLDSDLVSGLGSAISISYAEAMIKENQKDK